MSQKRNRRPDRPVPPRRSGGRQARWLALGLAAVGALGIAAFVVLSAGGRSPGGATAWARLGTADVHSLAFVGDDRDHLLFGHHHGLLETVDGGRSWRPLATQADAMEMGAAANGSIVIAGHNVFTASKDGGATWSDIPADLPSLDIHGFTRDPAQPSHMRAYPTSGGFWENRDGGVHWEQVYADTILAPVATTETAEPVTRSTENDVGSRW